MMQLKNEKRETIFTIERESGAKLELSKIASEDGKDWYSINSWTALGNPQAGIKINVDELEKLHEALEEYLYWPIDESETDEEKEIAERLLDFRNFLIRDNQHLDCTINEHDYEEVCAVLYINVNGIVKKEKASATYCRTCNVYYITEGEYNRLKEYGHIMCQVMGKEQYSKYVRGIKTGTLKEESQLHAAGYNVGKKDNLSDKCRQTILQYVVESGLMTKKDVINHIGYLIWLHESKKDDEEAVKKWRRDRNFLTGYVEGGKRLVGIRYLIEE